jgi:ATP-dependent protease ClpP protease subunit
LKKYDDFTNEPIIKNDVLQVRENNNRKEVDFYLIDIIDDIADYIDFLREVDSCRDGDLITVHINCYGGNADVGMNIYDCLRQSPANVEVSIEGACCSCASMIMLAGNCWRVTPHAYVMVHSWSEGIYGKWHEIVSKFNYDMHVFRRQFGELYKNFLTDKEIEDCIAGKDFYFDSNEIVKRLNNYQKEDIECDEAIKKITSKYSSLAEKEVNQYLKKSSKKK